MDMVPDLSMEFRTKLEDIWVLCTHMGLSKRHP